MTLLSRLTFGILLAASVTIGCSGDSSSTTPGTGGSTGGTGGGGGGTTGGGGTSGTGGGGGGTGATFMAMIPCPEESSYTTTGTTVMFGGALLSNYAPKCLKVSAGATVTFSGDNFAFHPLQPSTMRGTLTGNPITLTNTGMSKEFTFPTPGFYAYFCMFHGLDNADFMNGVVWVQ